MTKTSPLYEPSTLDLACAFVLVLLYVTAFVIAIGVGVVTLAVCTQGLAASPLPVGAKWAIIGFNTVAAWLVSTKSLHWLVGRLETKVRYNF